MTKYSLPIVVTTALVAYLFATDVYTPSMPAIALYFNATSDQVQTTISAFLLGSVLACIFSGPLADFFGKRRIFILGFSLSLLASILCWLTSSLDVLIWARFFQGVGAAVAPVVGFSLLQERYSEKDVTKLYGIVGVFLAVIPSIAPILGGYLNTFFDWRANFLAILMMIGFSLLGVYAYIVESPGLEKRQKFSVIRSYTRLLKSRTYMRYVMVIPFIYAGEWFYLAFLPFYFQDTLGVTSERFGIYVASIMIWYALGSAIANKMIDRLGRIKTIKFTLYLCIGAGLFLTFLALISVESVFLVCFALSINSFGFGISFPSTVSKALNAVPDLKSSASSLRSLIVLSFAFLGSLLAKVMPDDRLISLALVILLLALMSFFIFVVLGEKKE